MCQAWALVPIWMSGSLIGWREGREAQQEMRNEKDRHAEEKVGDLQEQVAASGSGPRKEELNSMEYFEVHPKVALSSQASLQGPLIEVLEGGNRCTLVARAHCQLRSLSSSSICL